jgi:DNA-binding NarL/FixJ family response regulator
MIRLTPTEQLVFDAYLEGKMPKDIMQMMNIKETTLKYHNRNIYSKLGVSSRKQMLEIAAALNLKNAPA